MDEYSEEQKEKIREAILKLRKETNFGLMDCKAAYVNSNMDYDAAKKELYSPFRKLHRI